MASQDRNEQFDDSRELSDFEEQLRRLYTPSADESGDATDFLDFFNEEGNVSWLSEPDGEEGQDYAAFEDEFTEDGYAPAEEEALPEDVEESAEEAEDPPRPTPQRRPAPRPAGPRPPVKKKKTGPFTIIGRILAVLGTSVLMIALFVVGLILILAHGPSEKAQQMFVFSTNETSALKAVPYWFMDDAQVDAILYPEPVVVEPDTFVEIGYEDAADQEEEPLVQVDTQAASSELEIVDIKEATFKGKMLIIPDPSRVVIGSLDYFGDLGIYLTEFIEKYGAIAGTNAGGFYDPDGQGKGGIPDGLVIRDGAIAYGSPYTYYIDVIGFDADHVLHVGDMTGQQALDLGVVNAISFSQGPVLIKDGVRQSWTNVSVNPRTCIGQRADGAVLLAVIEGRHLDSIGASFDDLADLMEKYGAVNAANLDGGSSSAMIYEGEQITKGSNIIGSRRMATAILVLP